MKRYKIIVVPLELSEVDDGAIAWAAKITHLASSHEVVFINALSTPDIPKKAIQKYPWLAEPLEKTILERMKKSVMQKWEGREETNLNFQVVKNVSSVLSILYTVLKHEADLVIVSREAFGSEMAVRLARKAPCSVMSVPDKAPAKLTKILVPTDFSDFSKAAIEVSVAFADAEGLCQIDSVHAYNIGNYPHRAAIPESELIEIAEDVAVDKHSQFIGDLETRGITVNPHNVYNPLISVAALTFAKDNGHDLIVVGCRGKNTFKALLLGSNAEDLLKHSPVPVIAAKPKGTGKSLLESLLES